MLSAHDLGNDPAPGPKRSRESTIFDSRPLPTIHPTFLQAAELVPGGGLEPPTSYSTCVLPAAFRECPARHTHAVTLSDTYWQH
jgi:hypothetical protein